MTDRRQYASLDAALLGEGIPEANWATIHGITTSIEITSYAARADRGIRAVRADGGPDLRIESGHTIGFLNRDEAERAAPEHETWPNNEQGSRWGVTHPVHAHRDGGPRIRESAMHFCSECFTARAANGTCGCPE